MWGSNDWLVGMTRVNREAQSMGCLGSPPPTSSPCSTWANKTGSLMVTELMGGDDVEGLVEDSPENRVPMEQAWRYRGPPVVASSSLTPGT